MVTLLGTWPAEEAVPAIDDARPGAMGVKISCIASSIFPPGATMMFGRDMKES